MAKKQKPSEVPYDQPDLAFVAHDQLNRIYFLRSHEWMDMRTSSNHVHASQGPGILHEQIDRSGRHVTEMDLDDPGFWGWIGRLISHDPEIKLLTQTDREIYDQFGDRVPPKPITVENSGLVKGCQVCVNFKEEQS